MTEEELFQIFEDKLRKRLLKYTRKAFYLLPKLNKPLILDIGCGSGIPTIELARLSQGKILGIDIDQPALDVFIRRIAEAGFTDAVQAVNCSLFNINFQDESFDIIWSEGSIYVIGFERGLCEWKRFLKPGGFMVIHDEQGILKEKLEQISQCGYTLLDYFILSKYMWHKEYFAPLEDLINSIKTKHPYAPKLLKELDQAQREFDIFNKDPEHSNSVYFIMRK